MHTAKPQQHTDITEPNKDLRTVKVGQRAVVSAIKSCPKDLLHKLVSMGLVEGTEVEVTQRGFFGSPINIHLLGSVLSLRSVEAAHIQVQPL
jgi:Fe2+ transport system protein FeoA